MNHILIICSRSPSNAFIVQSLSHLNPTIVHYEVQNLNRLQTNISKVKRKGIWHALGIKLTSLCLRLERMIERLTQKTLWNKLHGDQPDWKALNKQTHSYHVEEDLYPLLAKHDCIVLLESFRFSNKFYRICRQAVLQVIDGIAPTYMGNAGIFWAYAIKDHHHIGKTIIARKANFSKFTIMKTVNVPVASRETIRSLQIKGSLKVAKELEQVIDHYLKEGVQSAAYSHPNLRLLSSPNIIDYLSSVYFKGTLKQIPDYAKR